MPKKEKRSSNQRNRKRLKVQNKKKKNNNKLNVISFCIVKQHQRLSILFVHKPRNSWLIKNMKRIFWNSNRESKEVWIRMKLTIILKN